MNKYLSILGFDLVFEFDESFNDVIKLSGCNEMPYHGFSEGEKARVDLAILFAFRDVSSMKSGSSVNLLLMDEVLDSTLDEIGKTAFFEIMKILPDSVNLFVISHQQDIDDKFDSVIKMEKKNKFSELKYIT